MGKVFLCEGLLQLPAHIGVKTGIILPVGNLSLVALLQRLPQPFHPFLVLVLVYGQSMMEAERNPEGVQVVDGNLIVEAGSLNVRLQVGELGLRWCNQ